MDIRPFTESQSSRILHKTPTRWAEDQRLKSQDHAGIGLKPAGGLGLEDNNLTSAAWDVSLLPDTDSGSDNAPKSIVESIDSNDSNDNVHAISVMYTMMCMNMRTMTRGHRVLQTLRRPWRLGKPRPTWNGYSVGSKGRSGARQEGRGSERDSWTGGIGSKAPHH